MLLLEFGLPLKLDNFIMCYSLLINIWPTLTFHAKKWLRQEARMFPNYLFVLAMKYLNKSLKHNSDFNYHPRCSKMDLVHICFAYDLLMCCMDDRISIKLLQILITTLKSLVFKQINLEKSSLYVAGLSHEF